MAYSVSSPSSSTRNDEYIGIESCLDLENNEDIFASSSKKEETNYGRCNREKRDQRWAKKKEFPPPITLLARTENLPSHMPWVLKRYYTSDGRLILREEKFRPFLLFLIMRDAMALRMILSAMILKKMSKYSSKNTKKSRKKMKAWWKRRRRRKLCMMIKEFLLWTVPVVQANA
ncbi:hypothetical protein NC651_013755 [Populus alba x Populus x berolinensis]|nr:hypothetical protein NC651_013755 [Populus alba x Populus x berolinensis]